MKHPLILGITGKIGSGKTTVGQIFAKLGAEFLNTDQIVHQLYQFEKKGWQLIEKYFGAEYLGEKEVNRKKLAELVFNNPEKLALLNRIIHPLVFAEIKKLIEKSPKKLIVIEAVSFSGQPLGQPVNQIITVTCPEKTILARNKKYPENLIKKILKIQKKIFPKNSNPATLKIKNSRNKASLIKEIKKISDQYKN